MLVRLKHDVDMSIVRSGFSMDCCVGRRADEQPRLSSYSASRPAVISLGQSDWKSNAYDPITAFLLGICCEDAGQNLKAAAHQITQRNPHACAGPSDTCIHNHRCALQESNNVDCL